MWGGGGGGRNCSWKELISSTVDEAVREGGWREGWECITLLADESLNSLVCGTPARFHCFD